MGFLSTGCFPETSSRAVQATDDTLTGYVHEATSVL